MKSIITAMIAISAMFLPLVGVSQDTNVTDEGYEQKMEMEHEMVDVPQKDKAKHDHRKMKGFPSSNKPDNQRNEENGDMDSQGKKHDHSKQHKYQ